MRHSYYLESSSVTSLIQLQCLCCRVTTRNHFVLHNVNNIKTCVLHNQITHLLQNFSKTVCIAQFQQITTWVLTSFN